MNQTVNDRAAAVESQMAVIQANAGIQRYDWMPDQVRDDEFGLFSCRVDIFLGPILTLLMAATLLISGYAQAKEVRISGTTMATTYHIKVVAGAFDSLNGLRREIKVCLDGVNSAMSTFLPDSEISRFNHGTAVGAPFQVSSGFFQVLVTASRLHGLTQGAWDGTVGTLVDLWGFGQLSREARVPEPSEIESTLAAVDFSQIRFCGEGCISKASPRAALDLASIAKGYGVDAVAGIIARAGWKDFLVEIGGEIYAAGRRPDGAPWRVGINRPRPDAAPTDVYQVVALENMALATSGDYRNFFEIGGLRYSHILDPRTGYPVKNGVVSATVLAPDCAFADGLATALMVMGPQKGLALVQSLAGVECLIIIRGENGELVNHTSKGFGAFSLPMKRK